jgi:hypothetical protein
VHIEPHFLKFWARDIEHLRATVAIELLATQCILGFEPIKERMCKLRIKGKFNDMTIISVYAPTEDENNRNAEDVERFYNMWVI